VINGLATYWTEQHHVKSTIVVRNAIKALMYMCVADIPLSQGKLWKFPKFHELLHLLDNMERFGAPINYCAQRPESLLILFAKNLDAEHKNVTMAQRTSFNLHNDCLIRS
jgi:hypothetical protein